MSVRNSNKTSQRYHATSAMINPYAMTSSQYARTANNYQNYLNPVRTNAGMYDPQATLVHGPKTSFGFGPFQNLATRAGMTESQLVNQNMAYLASLALDGALALWLLNYASEMGTSLVGKSAEYLQEMYRRSGSSR